ncbi:MAG: ABC transporter permease [Roseiflexaceae bacterium]
MNLFESFRLALGALRANKLRSGLTMLGIIIGVGSIVALLAFGNGYAVFLDKEFRKMGNGVFYIFPGSTSRKVDETIQPQLNLADTEAIRAPGALPAVLTAAAVINDRAVVSSGSARGSYDIVAAEPAYLTITTNEIGAGRFYTMEEEQARARVAVIGKKVAERLFGTIDTAVGQRVNINGVSFEVIGVLTTKPGFTGDPQKSVLMPYQSGKSWLFRNQFDRRVDLSQIVVQAKSRQDVDSAVRQTTELLRERHRLTYQPNGFTILNLEQLMAQINAILVGFNAFLGVVAGISLLVGGIGIMNIMLVSVTERTKEIGLRKAVGAKRWDILQQFLIEAIVLCLVGGLLGVGLGYLLSPIGTLMLQGMIQADGNSDARAIVTLDAILLATGMAGLVGLVFGFFPALHASRMNPIDALRTE